MRLPPFSLIFPLVSLLFSFSFATQNFEFVQCLESQNADFSISSSNILYTPQASSYSSILQISIQNLVFNSSTTLKPTFIITPLDESHVQATVICSSKNQLQLRIRSGGHDYEGLSYISNAPFVLIDLVNLRKVYVNLSDNTAWVQAGAILGEVYYSIFNQSKVHGFPAGVCPTIGVGGHISGGGQGTLMRKYGLAADNVVDAKIVDAKGNILDRSSPAGEDLFWAIRGGGGGSFGVILSWKITLVKVPPLVTVFTARRTLEQGAEELVNRWQQTADKFHEDLFIRVIISRANDSRGGKTVGAAFNSLFLGTIKELLPLMTNSFPELGLKAEECREMSWLETILYFDNGYPNGISIDSLLNRTRLNKPYFKAKSDFVKTPIPITGLKGLSELFLDDNAGIMIMDPYGGKMSSISKSKTPFPHRRGTLYNIQYFASWYKDDPEVAKNKTDWIKKLYTYMTPYVSKFPRSSYLNYKDLDLGKNVNGNASYSEAIPWGTMYFGDNFERLAKVKAIIDTDNFFRDEQSIPPYSAAF